jgi:hypothetical protein
VLTADHLLQALKAGGVTGRNVIYVSVPITSGLREVELLVASGMRSAEQLRRTRADAWMAEVKRPNEAEAVCHVAGVRSAHWAGGSVVVDPSRIEVKGWEQDDYNRFWIRLMQEHVRCVVAIPGWQYSRGARAELGFALALAGHGVEVVDVAGQLVPAAAARAGAEEAEAHLSALGWSPVEVRAYLPAFVEAEPRLAASAQSEVFEWLIGERERQVHQFGAAADNEHLVRDALRSDGWWVTQLARYLERARELGLDDERGRLELAKFTATALGALESAVRLFGPIAAMREEVGGG